jgi:hypothetical protein
MATRTSEPWDMIEQWKAEHPGLASGSPAPPPPRTKAVPPPAPPQPPQVDRREQRAMIERWSQAHPELTGRAAPRPAAPARDYARPAPTTRPDDSDRRMIDIANTPLTVLTAFILGCIIGGIAMTIITGLAFWGFSGG